MDGGRKEAEEGWSRAWDRFGSSAAAPGPVPCHTWGCSELRGPSPAPSPPTEPDQEPTALGCSWPAPWDPPNRPCPPHTRIQHILSHLRREAARAALTHPGLISIKWKAEITGTSKGNWKDRGKKEKKQTGAEERETEEKKGKELLRAGACPANWKSCSEVSTGDPAKSIDFISGHRGLFLFHTNFHGQRRIKMAETPRRGSGGGGGRGGGQEGPAGDKKRMRGGKFCCQDVPGDGPLLSPAAHHVSSPSPPPPGDPGPGIRVPLPTRDTGMRVNPRIPAVFLRCGGSIPVPLSPARSRRLRQRKIPADIKVM